jgi:hypothetical protein
MNPEQSLKMQIGELIWINHIQSSQIENLTQELKDLKEKTNETNV